MEGQKTRSACVRCHRKLSDPVSVKRGMGPVCWSLSNGDVFEDDLHVSDEKWAQREKLLKSGCEDDLGTNWQYAQGDCTYTMRVSVRYKDGAYEVYGCIFKSWHDREEILFARCADIRDAYQAAIIAGPTSNAQVYAANKAAAQTWKAQQKKRGVA